MHNRDQEQEHYHIDRPAAKTNRRKAKELIEAFLRNNPALNPRRLAALRGLAKVLGRGAGAAGLILGFFWPDTVEAPGLDDDLAAEVEREWLEKLCG